jgi:starch synthase/alpha-amylase
MTTTKSNPRILIVTPEVTYLPPGMGNIANQLSAKAGGLADVSAALISSLFDLGADIHVALPDYRTLFDAHLPAVVSRETDTIFDKMPECRIHLAEDRVFYYMHRVYSEYGDENIKIALAFQREVINHIIPGVKPDLIHCNDWMTGLIPAMARKMGIPCLFTIHNIHTVKTFLSFIEDRGIDAAYFWQNLYYERMTGEYEDTRESTPVDLLTSGVFAAHYVNTVSPSFLNEIVEGRHFFIETPLKDELANKVHAGCAVGILNAPDPSFNPENDSALGVQYNSETHLTGKRQNKELLQKNLGLVPDSAAPIFFWPSRLDNIQKGCRLLAEIIYSVVSRYWAQMLQVVFVANGEFQASFKGIVDFHNLHNRIAVCNFNEPLARNAYGAADFVLMPSLFEPCGLPQMIGPIYGALPVVHDTGGLHDAIVHLNVEQSKGNGFLFETHDPGGLSWSIDQAMHFYNLPQPVKERQIKRIMEESRTSFNHDVTARQYIDLYERMLKRPLVTT